jgi:hypothetical protein
MYYPVSIHFETEIDKPKKWNEQKVHVPTREKGWKKVSEL